MRTWRGIGIISTMRNTRLWDCRLGVGWSRVRVSGSSNSASREWGYAGVRPDLTICYISDSPGSTARLRPCFRYSSNHPPTRNYARKHHRVRQRAHCILLSFEGRSTTDLLHIFDVDRLTVYHWFDAWE